MMACRGQDFRHMPQSVHAASLMEALPCLMRMAEVGHTFMQCVHPVHCVATTFKAW